MISFESKHRHLRRRQFLGLSLAALMLAILSVLCGVALREAAADFQATWRPGPALSSLLLAGVLAFLARLWWALGVAMKERPRIVPYFKNRLQAKRETWGAFRSGFGIATDLTRLDDLARESGVTPLSEFGFSDDSHRDLPKWCDPGDGLRSLSVLREKVCQEPNSASEATLKELDLLAAAIGKAAELGIPFRLIVRLGRDRFISSVEMSRREGSFW